MKPLEKMYLDECDAITYSDVMQNLGPVNQPEQPKVNKPEYLTPHPAQVAVKEGIDKLKSEVENNPAQALYGGVKGTAEGFVGLPGDIISLVRGVVGAVQTPEGKSKLEEFVKGMEGKTGLPTTEDVTTFLNSFIPPSTAPTAEFAGEMLAPGGYIKAGKAIVKTPAKAMKTLSKGK